uniref:Holliday junction resolvase n=1 Tax=Pithovirus LCDPAC01 TaxID=2506600 RepID=A0A481YPC1_9VIRU|nr:MAG: holliday junction resolvase [Pithovirus LCDPAC01]
MFRKKIKCKEDKRPYIKYYPVDRTKIEAKDLTMCVSIDIGIKNFALRIEERKEVKLPVIFEKMDFKGESESGPSTISPIVMNTIFEYLKSRWFYISQCNLVLIERQMGTNPKSISISMIVLTYVLLKIKDFPSNVVVCDINPKAKNKHFNAPKHVTSYGLKKWAVDKAIEVLRMRSDDWSADIIVKERGKTKSKGDDLADTVLQLDAFFKSVEQ